MRKSITKYAYHIPRRNPGLSININSARITSNLCKKLGPKGTKGYVTLRNKQERASAVPRLMIMSRNILVDFGLTRLAPSETNDNEQELGPDFGMRVSSVIRG